MAKFFVGQRVRVVGAGASRCLIGMETVIAAPAREALGLGDEKYFGYPTKLTNVCGIPFVARPDWLEPILSEGSAPSTWDACLWRPDGSHKKVAEEGRAVALRAVHE
jgi:hypothetical protein